MNNYKITFSILQEVYDAIQKHNPEVVSNFLNTIPGKNILEKFKKLLIIWNNDVNGSLPFKLEDKVSNVSIQYLLSEMTDISGEILLIDEDFEAILDIPDIFTCDDDIIPIYTILKSIKVFDITLSFHGMDLDQRKMLIDKLPPTIYSKILNRILYEKSKTIKFTHPALESFSLNFLTMEPFLFSKNLFSNHDDYYFRDIVYYLSPRVGSNLGNSTIQDIDYYIKKLSVEGDSGTTPVTL